MSQEILKKAERFAERDKEAMELAKTLHTPAAIKKEVANTLLGKKVASTIEVISGWVLAISGLGFLVALVGGVASMIMRLPMHVVFGVWFLFLMASGVGMIVGAVFHSPAEGVQADYRKKLDLLSPIAGSSLCPIALEYIKTGPADVIEWRDHAVAQRGELYGFDVEVVRCLALGSKAQEINEAACKELYEITAAA